MIEPEDEASGTAEVFVQVIDEVGNIWTDSFFVEVEPVMDPRSLAMYQVSFTSN